MTKQATRWVVSHISPAVMEGHEITAAQRKHINAGMLKWEIHELWNQYRRAEPNRGNWVYDTYEECAELCKSIEENNSHDTLRSVYGKSCIGTFKPMRWPRKRGTR